MKLKDFSLCVKLIPYNSLTINIEDGNCAIALNAVCALRCRFLLLRPQDPQPLCEHQNGGVIRIPTVHLPKIRVSALTGHSAEASSAPTTLATKCMGGPDSAIAGFNNFLTEGVRE